MVGQLGRGNALHGREATRSLLRYLCAAITEHVRVTVEQSLPGNLSIEDGATLRQVLFDMPRTMSDLSPQNEPKRTLNRSLSPFAIL
jgi:hypothetical protein